MKIGKEQFLQVYCVIFYPTFWKTSRSFHHGLPSCLWHHVHTRGPVWSFWLESCLPSLATLSKPPPMKIQRAAAIWSPRRTSPAVTFWLGTITPAAASPSGGRKSQKRRLNGKHGRSDCKGREHQRKGGMLGRSLRRSLTIVQKGRCSALLVGSLSFIGTFKAGCKLLCVWAVFQIHPAR